MSFQVAVHHASPAYRSGLTAGLRRHDVEAVEPEDVALWAEGDGARGVIWHVSDESSWRRMQEVAALPTTTVVALIPEIDLGLYARALASGADGVAHVDSPVEMICAVTESAVHGEVVIPAEAARQMAVCTADIERPERPPLSEQESHFLQRLSTGSTVVDLARDVFASERTVRRSLQNLYLKLGVANRAQALTRAAQLGLL